MSTFYYAGFSEPDYGSCEEKQAVPTPSSKPLKSNPFEAYRDPATGQWKVRYPASELPTEARPTTLSTAESDLIRKKLRWKKAA